eukprot:comp24344_c4_seq1/m.46418 comp24344_c4_seq1/g.46418  ORF comp24344_c4_seq1/g.46418 comp24344_c4_seq1/m.46418 type:complete len:617 (-) comp24344_c4_seq1:425-2275(-)
MHAHVSFRLSTFGRRSYMLHRPSTFFNLTRHAQAYTPFHSLTLGRPTCLINHTKTFREIAAMNVRLQTCTHSIRSFSSRVREDDDFYYLNIGVCFVDEFASRWVARVTNNKLVDKWMEALEHGEVNVDFLAPNVPNMESVFGAGTNGGEGETEEGIARRLEELQRDGSYGSDSDVVVGRGPSGANGIKDKGNKVERDDGTYGQDGDVVGETSGRDVEPEEYGAGSGRAAARANQIELLARMHQQNYVQQNFIISEAISTTVDEELEKGPYTDIPHLEKVKSRVPKYRKWKGTVLENLHPILEYARTFDLENIPEDLYALSRYSVLMRVAKDGDEKMLVMPTSTEGSSLLHSFIAANPSSVHILRPFTVAVSKDLAAECKYRYNLDLHRDILPAAAKYPFLFGSRPIFESQVCPIIESIQKMVKIHWKGAGAGTGSDWLKLEDKLRAEAAARCLIQNPYMVMGGYAWLVEMNEMLQRKSGTSNDITVTCITNARGQVRSLLVPDGPLPNLEISLLPRAEFEQAIQELQRKNMRITASTIREQAYKIAARDDTHPPIRFEGIPERVGEPDSEHDTHDARYFFPAELLIGTGEWLRGVDMTYVFRRNLEFEGDGTESDR